MALLQTDIVLYQTVEAGSLGGAISVTPVPQGIDLFFNNVEEAEAEAGSTVYRCFYIANESATDDLTSGFIYISVRTPSNDTACELGLGTAGVDGTEQTIADETVAPAGVTFAPTSEATPLVFGATLPAGSNIPVWIKRIVSPNAAARLEDYCVLTIGGQYDDGT